MAVTIHKRDGSTVIVGKTKPKGPTRFILNGEGVTLSEAARILDVGLRTIMRHTRKGVIDVTAIRALVPGEPLRNDPATLPQARRPAHTPLERKSVKPKRSPRTYTFADRTLTLREWSDLTGLSLDLLRCRVDVYGWEIGRALSQPVATASVDSRRRNQNRKFIARIAATFHEAPR